MSETVDVVIPTRNTRDVTLRCVASVLEDDGAHVNCIVVDNGSEDGTAEAIEARFPTVTLVTNSANVGYARACNQGARNGRADYILVLNSDVIAGAGAVGRLATFLASHLDYVAASGKLVHPGTDRPQVGFAVRGYPRVWNQAALLAGLERLWPTNPVSRRYLMHDFDYDRTRPVDGQPAGACFMCRRSDYEAVGGFDEGFHYWFEDVDLIRRLGERGRIAYVHDAVFEHLGGLTFAQWSRADVIETRYRSLLRYFGKHHSRTELAILRGIVALLAIVRALPLAPFDRKRARAYLVAFGAAVRPSLDEASGRRVKPSPRQTRDSTSNGGARG
jgi:N-acetylglucosaminyl-diphospho-decaprenol L-rhamnosyltransferase